MISLRGYLNKPVKKRLLVAAGWLALMTLLRWRFYLPLGRQTLELIVFWLGGLVGTFLIDLDHWLYLLVIHPNHPGTLKLKAFLSQKQYQNAWNFFYQTRPERRRLAFHSALFQPAFYVLIFFVVTSTTNQFGVAMVMVMALQLLYEELSLLLSDQDDQLRLWLFWQFDGQITHKQQKIFVYLMLLVFLFLHLLII